MDRETLANEFFRRLVLVFGVIGTLSAYAANQLNIGCLPYRDGTLVFYANRTSTDQIAGMGSSLKHSIGREQMQAEIVKRLKNLQKLLKT